MRTIIDAVRDYLTSYREWVEVTGGYWTRDRQLTDSFGLYRLRHKYYRKMG